MRAEELKVAIAGVGRRGFTLPELLVAIGLVSIVAVVLASVVHQLLRATEAQSERVMGPYAVQEVLHEMAVDVACAFAPPVHVVDTNAPDDEAPPPAFALEGRGGFSEPVRLSLLTPERDAADLPLYGMRQVTYEIAMRGGAAMDGGAEFEWRRIESPTSGPEVDTAITNILYRGPLRLGLAALPPPPEEEDEGGDSLAGRRGQVPEPVLTWPPLQEASWRSGEGTNEPPVLPGGIVATVYEGAVPRWSVTWPVQCGIPVRKP